MQKFTSYEYMLIALANANGMDKMLWNERIDWADGFIKLSVKDQLEYASEECTGEPLLLAKGINAHREILKGNDVGFMCNLDATASGIQVMSAITGCHQSAAKVNLINNGKRNDLYLDTAHIMNNKYGCNVERSDLKDPIMHAFYGSEATPKKVFGSGTPALAAFINTLKTGLKGAYSLLLDIQSLQDSNAKSYTWTLPDLHTSYVPVMEAVDKKVEIAEFNKATFTFRTKVNQPKEFDLSLAANVVHSIDGYIVRQLFRRAKAMGYHMTAIHDSFWAHPNNIEDVRIGYAMELAKLSRSNVIQNILNELSGNSGGTYIKCSNDLAPLIENSDYALS